jgi:hypothetical protein
VRIVGMRLEGRLKAKDGADPKRARAEWPRRDAEG